MDELLWAFRCDAIAYNLIRDLLFSRRVHGSLQLLCFVSHLPSTQHDTHPITARVIIMLAHLHIVFNGKHPTNMRTLMKDFFD